MEKQDYYELVHPLERLNDHFEATIRFKGEHPIFAGHFPGRPVVPGVCMMAIVRYLTAEALGQQLRFKEVSQLKFIRMIDPGIAQDVQVVVSFKLLGEQKAVQVNASFTIEDTTCFKFVQGIYQL